MVLGRYLSANHSSVNLQTRLSGGVVNNKFFQSHFGIAGNQKQIDAVSSNVVSVLQAGAFFGALGSAPVSCEWPRIAVLLPWANQTNTTSLDRSKMDHGVVHRGIHSWSGALFLAIHRVFLTNIRLQILQTIASGPPHGLGLIYAGRVIAGLGIGGISSVAPAFVSECSPKDVRGRITGCFQIMVSIQATRVITRNLTLA